MVAMNNKTNEEEEIQPIPDRVLNWLTVAGFIALYMEKQSETSTLKAAYLLAEKDFLKAYKKRKYNCYQTFINAKWQWTRRMLDKNKTK